MLKKLLAFDQIQLDAYCIVVWRRFEATFKLRPVIPIFERKEMTECPRKPRQPTSIGITWHIQPFSMQRLVSVFLPLVCFLPVFFPGDSQFYEEDILLWIGPCYNVRSLFRLNNVIYIYIYIYNIYIYIYIYIYMYVIYRNTFKTRWYIYKMNLSNEKYQILLCLPIIKTFLTESFGLLLDTVRLIIGMILYIHYSWWRNCKSHYLRIQEY